METVDETASLQRRLILVAHCPLCRLAHKASRLASPAPPERFFNTQILSFPEALPREKVGFLFA